MSVNVTYSPWQSTNSDPTVTIVTPVDSSQSNVKDTLRIYAAGYDSTRVDSVTLDISYPGGGAHFSDKNSPFQVKWLAPGTLPPNSIVQIEATVYAPNFHTGRDRVTVFTVGSNPPVVAVTPISDSTSLGGIRTYIASVTNPNSVALTGQLWASGLPSAWLSQTNWSFSVAASQTIAETLSVSIPFAPANLPDTGLHSWTLSTSFSNSDTITKPVSIYISPKPRVVGRWPLSNSAVVGTSAVISWETSGPSACTLSVARDSVHATWTKYTTATGRNHSVTISGLLNGHTYYWYVSAVGQWGRAVATDTLSFQDLSGVRFSATSVNQTLQMAYDQHTTVAVQKSDTLAYWIKADVTNPDSSLIIGFVGAGSPDQPLYLTSSSTNLDLRVHTQDTKPGIYNLNLVLTSWRDDTSQTSIPMQITVLAPNDNLEYAVINTDTNTLAKTVQIVNRGAQLTDFSVQPSDSIAQKVYLEPQIEHYLFKTSETLLVTVVPYLTVSDTTGGSLKRSPKGLISQFSTSAASIVKGDLELKYASKKKTQSLDFTPPSGRTVWMGTASSVRFCKSVKSWYCTNRPRVTVQFTTPSGLDPATINAGTLGLTFEPSSGVPQHDVQVEFNGSQVGKILGSVPTGNYAFDIPGSDINFSTSGNASNYATIISTWNTAGHYLVADGFEFCVCLDRYSQYVIASSQVEADQWVGALPHLKSQVGTLAITQTAPASGTTFVKLVPVVVQATVLENGIPPNDLIVKAQFSSGDDPVMLYDDGGHSDGSKGDGIFAGTWYPRVVGNTNVTIVAGLCGQNQTSSPVTIAVSYPKVKAIAPIDSDHNAPVADARCEILRNGTWLPVLGRTDANGILEVRFLGRPGSFACRPQAR